MVITSPNICVKMKSAKKNMALELHTDVWEAIDQLSSFRGIEGLQSF